MGYTIVSGNSTSVALHQKYAIVFIEMLEYYKLEKKEKHFTKINENNCCGKWGKVQNIKNET